MSTNAMTTTERDDYQGLTMMVSPAEALKRVQELQAFVAAVMVRGVDYDVIPGTGTKPTLLQPGAQKLCEVYGFAATFEDAGSVLDWDKGFFFFSKRCVLTSRRDERFIGDGVGSCNSREDRYAWRWVWDKPLGVDLATLKTRMTRNGKQQWRLANDDLYSLVNTIEKMACKRALVHAVTGATRSSGVFTQDVEDLPREVFGHADANRSWAQDDAPKAETPPKAERDPKALPYYRQAIADAATLADLKKTAASIKDSEAKGYLSQADAEALKGPYVAAAAALSKTPAPAPTADEDIAAAIDRGDA